MVGIIDLGQGGDYLISVFSTKRRFDASIYPCQPTILSPTMSRKVG
jgi:hypothetical protein